jgi:hypothetical protein
MTIGTETRMSQGRSKTANIAYNRAIQVPEGSIVFYVVDIIDIMYFVKGMC